MVLSGGYLYVLLSLEVLYGAFAFGFSRALVSQLGVLQDASLALEFLLFYFIGRRIDFSRRWPVLLAAVVVAGFVALFPDLIEFTVSSGASSGAISGFVVSTSPLSLVDYIVAAFVSVAVPMAASALAFFTGRPAPADSSAIETTAGRPLRPPWLFVAGFVIVTLAYPISVAFSYVGVPANQFSFLQAILPGDSPWRTYVFDLFVPGIFFVSFFLLGRKTDLSRSLRASILFMGAGTFAGTLVGSLIEYQFQYPSLSTPLPAQLLENSAISGLVLLALAFTAASFGYLEVFEPRTIVAGPSETQLAGHALDGSDTSPETSGST